VYTLIEAISEIGGLFSVVSLGISFFCKEFTKMTVIHNFIKQFHSNQKGIFQINSEEEIPSQ